MPRRALDTNVLIRHWGDDLGYSRLEQVTPARAVASARRLVTIQRADAIVTPVYIEFICGHATAHSVRLAKAYLGVFEVIDAGRILPGDWDLAKRIAARVGPDGLRRQMGDCLIAALSERLNLEVVTFEKRFPLGRG